MYSVYIQQPPLHVIGSRVCRHAVERNQAFFQCFDGIRRGAGTSTYIQYISPNIGKITKRICCKEEINTFTTNEELAIVWSVKEALFKKHSHKDLNIISDIQILDIDVNGLVNAKIKTPTETLNDVAHTELWNNYVLAYS